MLSCKEIVKLLSSEVDVPLLKKAELRMHLMMCKHCSRYSKHLRMLSDGFKNLLNKKAQVDAAEVSKLEREVLEKLQRKVSK